MPEHYKNMAKANETIFVISPTTNEGIPANIYKTKGLSRDDVRVLHLALGYIVDDRPKGLAADDHERVKRILESTLDLYRVVMGADDLH